MPQHEAGNPRARMTAARGLGAGLGRLQRLPCLLTPARRAVCVLNRKGAEDWILELIVSAQGAGAGLRLTDLES